MSTLDPASFAAGQRELFAGHHLHVGRSHVIHAVDQVSWINGLTLPAPACRQGFAGHGAQGELRPTMQAVTCRRCRRIRGLDLVEVDADPQVALFAIQDGAAQESALKDGAGRCWIW